MRTVLPTVIDTLSQGRSLVLSTVVKVERRAPRGAGAAMVVDNEGRVTGSLSGGCIEPAIIQESQEVLASGTPRLRTFGISDEQAFDVGLSCGGTVHVLMEPLYPPLEEGPSAEGKVQHRSSSPEPLLRSLQEALEAETPVALVTAVDGPWARAGMMLVVDGEGRITGTTGDASRDAALAALAKGHIGLGSTGTASVEGGTVLIQAFAPPPRLYIIGAVHPAAALATAGRFLGYRVIVCDPRSPFATPERLPDAHEIVKEWPDQYLARVAPQPRDAVCVLTHDLKFDVPALATALASTAGYIGAMGSRRTHERRMAALRDQGIAEEDLARISSPIGLDIGAVTPEEIAVAIAAEMVAVRRRQETKLASTS